MLWKVRRTLVLTSESTRRASASGNGKNSTSWNSARVSVFLRAFQKSGLS
ncbi:hypothetical protein OCAE111667_03790 [Occultella aeris]|uniref:Uncharacterized protein n=1 Tax=Occultella aeris TaxID=2761496 RepID=A0A7M4DDN9_9MICO|nr:hypothetical protein HALOF300_00228 [Occultella aeris]